MLTYREEYKEYLDDIILRCLTCIQTNNEVKGFSCLIHYLKERYRSNLFDIKYYILDNFKPTAIEEALGKIYENTFIEIIKDLLDNKFNEICDFVDYFILYTNSKFELFIEFYTDTRLIEGREFFDNLKQLIPDITIHRTVNGELRD